MIPILYDKTETAFTSNGLGRLPDCTKCTVTEERNGIYECQFVYPVTGARYEDITEGRYIAVTHDDQGDVQPFEIYSRTAPLNGLVTFYAHHISYALRHIMLKPFTAHSAVQAMAGMKTNVWQNNPFTFWTDKETTGSFSVTYPRSIKEMLMGTEGSVLDAFGGGEYEWDGLTVKLYAQRGIDTGVEIRYGKNLTNLNHTVDTSGCYTSVAPFWRSPDDEIVYLDEGFVTSASATGDIKPVTLDLSEKWDSAPTQEQLRVEALRRLNNNQPWLPKENIKVNFVALWQTEEYANVAPLQRVSLCDTVSVIYPELGVDVVQQKVIKVVYNVLLDRYDSLELGTVKGSLSSVMRADLQTMFRDIPNKSTMQAAIDRATTLITGGLGGHVVIATNADGEPNEILIMDTDDMQTAVNVIRMNQNGIGFSTTGYEGPFSTAWTIDGSFVADFITSGNLDANLLTAGIITDRQGRNYWNLDTGEISISLSPGEEGEVTQADLARVQNNAQNYANAAQAAAEQYADDIQATVEAELSLTAQNLVVQFSTNYATKSELATATFGMITLQTPYEYANDVATFHAVVYKNGEDVTDDYDDGVFEWYARREDSVDRIPYGIGKTTTVNSADIKFGMTVVCRMMLLSEPDYWTDHQNNVITNEESTPFEFLMSDAVLECETTIYANQYTESRFSILSQTDEEIRAEVGRKINEDEAKTLISQTADAITAEAQRATAAEGTLRTSIRATAADITAEISRATNAEGSLSTRITATANSISTEVANRTSADSSLSSRITQNANSISTEIANRTSADNSLSSRITQNANSISTEVTNRTSAYNSLSSRIDQNADAIELRVTAGRVSSMIAASAESIRMQTTTLTWTATNSSLDENGVLKTVSTSDGVTRDTRMNGGRIQFYKGSTRTGIIFPINWGDTTKEGVVFEAARGASYATLAIETSSGHDAAFIANNGLNPEGFTQKCIAWGDMAIRGALTMTGTATIGGSANISGNASVGGTQLKVGQTTLTTVTYEDNYYAFRINRYLIVGSSAMMAGYMARISGSLYVNGTVTQGSDERKKNILPWDDKIDAFVRRAEPILYTWKDGEDDRLHVGLGAQRTARLLEELGLENQSFVVHSGEDEYGINYTELAPMMLSTLQKACVKIDELEQKVKDYEARLERLEKLLGGENADT